MDTGEKAAVEAVGTLPRSSVTPGDPALVRVTGRLDATDTHGVTDHLVAVLRDHGHVVADVSGLALGQIGAVQAFPTAVARAGGWPTAALVLAAPDPSLHAVLTSSGVARCVPVHPDVATAVARVEDRPTVVRTFWTFEVDPRAPGRARSSLRRVCRDWAIGEDVQEAAEIVVTELVTNAVEHAASPCEVEVQRVGNLLRMTVRDFDPAPLPAVADPDPHSVRGRGLAMVAAVSGEWGVDAHPDGKTVWSEIGV